MTQSFVPSLKCFPFDRLLYSFIINVIKESHNCSQFMRKTMPDLDHSTFAFETLEYFYTPSSRNDYLLTI